MGASQRHIAMETSRGEARKKEIDEEIEEKKKKKENM